MFHRSSNFAGGIAINRYAFGGLEGAFAVAALSLAAAATSGTAEADPYTYPSAGMVGPYRTISASSIEAEAVGSSSMSFAAAGVAYTSSLDLTCSFAGLIARERGEITINETTQFEFFLTASLQGLIDPLNEREFELVLSSSLAADTTTNLVRKGAGAAVLTFGAQARAGMIGAAALSFAAFGAGVGVGSPFVTGAGEGRLMLAAAATGQPTWPMSPAVTLTFSAQAVSEAESRTEGSAALTFAAVAAAVQDNAAAGAASLVFAAASNAGVTSYMDGEALLQFSASGNAGGQLADGVLEHRSWSAAFEHRQDATTLTHG